MENNLPLPIEVKLVGEDGNAFSIMSRVIHEMRKNGYSEYIEPFKEEAMSGDYNNLLRTCTKYVEVK